MSGEDVGLVVEFAGRHLEKHAHDVFDRHRDGVHYDDNDAQDGRDDQRHAVGIGERVCLRQHGGENDDEERHDGGRVGDADFADEQDGETRGKCRSQHVDQRVADEDRADHLLWPLQQLVHQRRTAIAFLLQRMHAGARSGGQRCLAAVEEGGQRDQHDDRQENERGNE